MNIKQKISNLIIKFKGLINSESLDVELNENLLSQYNFYHNKSQDFFLLSIHDCRIRIILGNRIEKSYIQLSQEIDGVHKDCITLDNYIKTEKDLLQIVKLLFGIKLPKNL